MMSIMNDYIPIYARRLHTPYQWRQQIRAYMYIIHNMEDWGATLDVLTKLWERKYVEVIEDREFVNVIAAKTPRINQN